MSAFIGGKRLTAKNEVRISLSDLLLFITLFAYEDYACLIPDDLSLPMGVRTTDVGVVLAVCWTIYVISRNHGRKLGPLHPVLPFALAIFSTILSAILASSLLGQPFLWGILPFRRMYAAMLLCIGVTEAMRSGVLSKDKLVSMLYVIGISELILYTLQALLAGYVTFLDISTSEVRFGLVRLRVPFLLPLIIGIISFHTFLDSRHKERLSILGHLIIAIWSVLFVALICQHRAPTIILLASYLFAIFISRTSFVTKVLASFVSVFLILGILGTPLIQSTVQALTGATTGSANTLEIRSDGHEYYLERLQNSPWFGFGWPNSNYSPATQAAGEGYLYYLEDNGIFGLAYMLGIFGCIWIAVLYLGALHRAWKIRRAKGGALLQYLFFETGNLYMGLHWFYYYPMPFMMALALLEYDSGEVADGKQ